MSFLTLLSRTQSGGGESPLSPAYELAMDGVDENVNFGDLSLATFDENSAFSIIYRVEHTSISSAKAHVSKLDETLDNRGWHCLNNGGALQFYMGNDGVGGGANYIFKGYNSQFSIGVPVFIVITFDGSNTAAGLNAYKNGSLLSPDTTVSTNTGTIATTAPFRIGARARTPQYFLTGSISWIGIFNSELSAAEVSALYNGDVNSLLDPRFDSGAYTSSANLQFFVPVQATDDPTVINGIVDLVASNDGTAENMESGDVVAL